MTPSLINLITKYDNASGEYVTKPATTSSLSQSEDEFAGYALTLTSAFNNSGQFTRKILEIKAPVLKQLCEDTIGDKYPGQSFKTERISMSCPPKPLFFYRNEFEGVRGLWREREKQKNVKYINLFIRLIKSELRNEIASYNSLISQGLVSYDIIWTIFPPHTKFLTLTHNYQPALYQLYKGVEVTEGCNPRFHLDCFGIDHDGFNFGYAASAVGVPPFEGTLPIATLPAVPLEFLPDAEKVIGELIERGRKSEKLQCSGSSYMVYKGRALGPIVDERRTYYSINGRVMVDPSTFARINPYRAISITSLQSANPFQSESEREWWNRDRDVFEDGYNGVKIDLDMNNVKHDIQERTMDKTGKFYIPLTDEQAAMVHPFARGFALAEKKWAEFAVADLKEVEWVPDAFNKLVLPKEQKELILSLVEAAPTDNAKYKFDDFIPSKGLGLVAVLHGPPGVGKTLTAEAVAEYTRRPLYSVTSGELGTEPSGLESTLGEILEVAGTWNAILLIDEADIFLEARSSSGGRDGIIRNAMVGIFLRLLEYFRGVMFLTTNRVETFDPAFKSRIHLAMRYRELSEEARVEVWRNFVSKLPGSVRDVELTEGEYSGVERLAKKWPAINGREIKNAVKTGLRIVQRRGGKLRTEVLEGVLRMGGEFDAQMKAGK
ncbi:P-loop containing nucleoside triphosphate hydrolase protein [Terfezia boudieri ATCC MYA-4762]|uniref:P-loop containing nucleoside triphosphate hydrolase protein n=1 Tax=Terfezia boudieri ATCC MYA-4762 TaxID=1051890 RepID=A0A3N4M0T7_9PEZI|nr:P-loop containing nucleoside triphosphate hydrolase protein [Terfezia boudieri ATCC MYA-4762]